MSGDIPVKKVRVTVIAEATENTPMDPDKYWIEIKSLDDSWFDLYPESVTIEEVAQ